jgi:hypothetical protein
LSGRTLLDQDLSFSSARRSSIADSAETFGAADPDDAGSGQGRFAELGFLLDEIELFDLILAWRW